ncbi:MAG: phosphoglucosamine mutase, partial [Spiroplasma sp.]|nr:phosphoglucosamine mutase [Mycoplasmatales bacterium]
IIYLLACELKKSNKLKDNLVVGTVMTNLGLKKALIDEEMVFLETQVGDRFVMEEIVTSGASVGGEQSGHIILPGFLPTGDGILCAVYLANIFSKNPMLLPTLIDNVVKYPQVLKNITVKNKTLVMEDKGLITLVEEQEALLSNGRILVRASGTEPLVRVMVEAQKMEQCEKICEIFSQYIKNIV